MDQNSIFTETANLGYPNCQLSTCIYNPFWGTQFFSHTNLKPPAWHENHVFFAWDILKGATFLGKLKGD